MPGAYYSGDLAGINQGRTADARVAADSQAAFQQYLASLAQNRSRENIANTEANTALRVASGDQGVRRELGLGDIALRSNLGQGALGNTATATAQAGELGKAGLTLEAQKIANELEISKRDLDLKEAAYKAGGFMDPKLREDIYRHQLQLEQDKAKAVTTAAIGNAALKDAVNQGHRTRQFLSYLPGVDTPAQAFQKRDEDYSDVVGNILRGLGPDAAGIEFDQASGQFIPSSTLFRPTIFPGGFVTKPGPTVSQTPDQRILIPPTTNAPTGIPNFQFVPGNQNQPTVFSPRPVVVPTPAASPEFRRQLFQNYQVQ